MQAQTLSNMTDLAESRDRGFVGVRVIEPAVTGQMGPRYRNVRLCDSPSSERQAAKMTFALE
jgi:hypothetical protein